MTTYRAFTLLGLLLLLATAIAYACMSGLPGDPTLIEQQIDNPLNELPPPIPADQIIDQPPRVEPTPVDVPPVEPPAPAPAQADPNSCEGGQCEVPSVPRQSSRRRGLFQRLFGR